MSCKAKHSLALFLGAGFSVRAGAPVMAQFIDAARSSLSWEDLRLVQSGFYHAGYVLRQKQPTLETAYGVLAFLKILRGDDFTIATIEPKEDGSERFVPAREGPCLADIIGAFQRAIAMIYGTVLLQSRKEWVSDYARFFELLRTQFTRVAVVTTNYDLVIETALRGCFTTRYSLESTIQATDAIPIYKLHGSVNWPEDGDHSAIQTDAAPVNAPLVVPPSWNKYIAMDSWIAKVWRDAVLAIREADSVLVIGHSFPATDLHLHYLFGEALARKKEHSSGKIITMVDPAPACEAFKRFGDYQEVSKAVLHRIPFHRLLRELEEDAIPL